MAEIIDAGPVFGKFLVGADGSYTPYIDAGPTFGQFIMQPGQTSWSVYTPPAAPAAGGGGTTDQQQCPPGEVRDEVTGECVLPSVLEQRQRQRREEEDRRIRDEETRRRNDEARRLSEEMAAERRRASQESARDLMSKRLEEYGLGNLGGFVWDLITKENITSEYALVERIRETEQYKTRFPAMKMRRDQGILAINEQEYIALEKGYRQAMKLAALPAGMFDTPEDFTNLIAGDVSVKELSTRIEGGYQAVAQSNPQVIAEMKRLYGVDDSGLAAYFLDPARATPILLRQARAAQVSAEGTLQAGLAVSQAQAEELAVAGVTQESAREGFQRIAQSGELFVSLPGTTEQAISQEEQIAGVFGTQASAQQRIRTRQRERQAVFEAGGRFAAQGTTVTGLQ
jgi:hypothetical protein